MAAQPSVTGCASLHEADAAMIPAADVVPGWTFVSTIAPFGLPGLSSGRVHTDVLEHSLAVFMGGRAAEGWTEITTGGRMRWTVDSSFAVGIRCEGAMQWFRNFGSFGTMRVSAHVLSRNDPWLLGAAIDDLVVAGLPGAPVVRCGVGRDLVDVKVAADLVMGAGRELGILVTADHRTPSIHIAGSLCTAPFTVRLATRIVNVSGVDVTLAIRYVEGLGIAPDLVVILP